MKAKSKPNSNPAEAKPKSSRNPTEIKPKSNRSQAKSSQAKPSKIKPNQAAPGATRELGGLVGGPLGRRGHTGLGAASCR